MEKISCEIKRSKPTKEILERTQKIFEIFRHVTVRGDEEALDLFHYAFQSELSNLRKQNLSGRSEFRRKVWLTIIDAFSSGDQLHDSEQIQSLVNEFFTPEVFNEILESKGLSFAKSWIGNALDLQVFMRNFFGDDNPFFLSFRETIGQSLERYSCALKSSVSRILQKTSPSNEQKSESLQALYTSAEIIARTDKIDHFIDEFMKTGEFMSAFDESERANILTKLSCHLLKGLADPFNTLDLDFSERRDIADDLWNKYLSCNLENLKEYGCGGLIDWLGRVGLFDQAFKVAVFTYEAAAFTYEDDLHTWQYDPLYTLSNWADALDKVETQLSYEIFNDISNKLDAS